jgi:3-oxoacyl-(acyl-carrier-protein) synthase
MRRVAITGMGVICALGRNTVEFEQSLLAGRAGIAPLEGFEPGVFRFNTGAEVRGYTHAGISRTGAQIFWTGSHSSR